MQHPPCQERPLEEGFGGQDLSPPTQAAQAVRDTLTAASSSHSENQSLRGHSRQESAQPIGDVKAAKLNKKQALKEAKMRVKGKKCKVKKSKMKKCPVKKSKMKKSLVKQRKGQEDAQDEGEGKAKGNSKVSKVGKEKPVRDHPSLGRLFTSNAQARSYLCSKSPSGKKRHLVEINGPENHEAVGVSMLGSGCTQAVCHIHFSKGPTFKAAHISAFLVPDLKLPAGADGPSLK